MKQRETEMEARRERETDSGSGDKHIGTDKVTKGGKVKKEMRRMETARELMPTPGCCRLPKACSVFLSQAKGWYC